MTKKIITSYSAFLFTAMVLAIAGVMNVQACGGTCTPTPETPSGSEVSGSIDSDVSNDSQADGKLAGTVSSGSETSGNIDSNVSSGSEVGGSIDSDVSNDSETNGSLTGSVSSGSQVSGNIGSSVSSNDSRGGGGGGSLLTGTVSSGSSGSGRSGGSVRGDSTDEPSESVLGTTIDNTRTIPSFPNAGVEPNESSTHMTIWSTVVTFLRNIVSF